MDNPVLLVALLVGISYFAVAIDDQSDPFTDQSDLSSHESANNDDEDSSYESTNNDDKLHKFPYCSSDMNRLISRWLHEKLPDRPTEISDNFDLQDTRFFGNLEVVAPILFNMADKEVAGDFLARTLTPAVFWLRRNCSSTLFYKFMALYIENRISNLLSESSSFYTVFETSLLQLLPIIGQSPNILQQTVEEMVHQTGITITEDTARFVLGLLFRDVAKFCEESYQRFVDPPIFQLEHFNSIVYELILDNQVSCWSGDEVLDMYVNGLDEFVDEFEMVEKENITAHVDEYLKEQIDILVETLGVNKTEEVNNTAYSEIIPKFAQAVSNFVHEVVTECKNFRNDLKQSDLGQLGEFFSSDLEQEVMLKEILYRLGLYDKMELNRNQELNEPTPTPYVP